MIDKQELLQRLRRVDLSGRSPREVLFLWAIEARPGQAIRELAVNLGFPGHSAAQNQVARLLRDGLIEDRRPVKGQGRLTPCAFHITPKGAEFLASILEG